jgi:site-specific DNA recombinase
VQSDSSQAQSISTPVDSTSCPTYGIDSVHMKKAALYARVSSDTQKNEGTIESQVAELKRQIATAGGVLVREYIDDGYTGVEMDRPGLKQLRADLKTDVFDTIYFLDFDRIARELAYQSIVLSELVNNGKQIIIKGKDYVNSPENKFAVAVFGAVAELERAKIMERTKRGWLHRLRQGEMTSNGHRIFGYDYVRKTPTSPAALLINEEQAAIVRSVFEMFASGNFGLLTISRHLEERGIVTRTGKALWDNDRIKGMLKNETYAGTRYFNRMTRTTGAAQEGAKPVRGQWLYRNPAEWIAVKVPAIVSQELFDQVQERLARHEERYCRPQTHYLLSGLVQCGCCGSRGSSFRGWHKVRRPSGKISVYHQSSYRCIRRAEQNHHVKNRIKEPCNNSSIATHILEGKVSELIRETMLNPGKLRGCIEGAGGLDDKSIARKLAKVASQLGKIEEERRNIINRYATEKLSGEDYIAANRALDLQQERLIQKKAELVAALRSPQQEDFVDASLRQFCATANLRWHACTHDDATRQFLVEYVERVIYNRYHVAIVGSVPVQSASGETKLRFRIEGEIDKKAVRVNATRKAQITKLQSAPELAPAPSLIPQLQPAV